MGVPTGWPSASTRFGGQFQRTASLILAVNWTRFDVAYRRLVLHTSELRAREANVHFNGLHPVSGKFESCYRVVKVHCLCN